MLKFIGFAVVVILVLAFIGSCSSCGGYNFLSGCSDVTNSITGIFS